jgi:hypothetical protein
MWYRSHGAGNIQMHNFEISTKTVEVQWKTDGMENNTHRHHMVTMQKNIECEKSQFCHCRVVIFIYVGRNIDTCAICILRRAICILHKFLCNMVSESISF